MSEDTSCGRGKDVNLFSNYWHASNKDGRKKEIAETTKIGLRTVQRIIENKEGRMVGAWWGWWMVETSSSRKECGQKRILNDHDR